MSEKCIKTYCLSVCALFSGGMGAHGWVVRFCQPSVHSLSWSSMMSQAPNLHLAIQLLINWSLAVPIPWFLSGLSSKLIPRIVPCSRIETENLINTLNYSSKLNEKYTFAWILFIFCWFSICHSIFLAQEWVRANSCFVPFLRNSWSSTLRDFSVTLVAVSGWRIIPLPGNVKICLI